MNKMHGRKVILDGNISNGLIFFPKDKIPQLQLQLQINFHNRLMHTPSQLYMGQHLKKKNNTLPNEPLNYVYPLLSIN